LRGDDTPAREHFPARPTRVTARLFDEDPDLLAFDATVVSVREHEGRPAAVLDRTAFYPESGGQPWDTGTLGAARVVAVLADGADVLHVLDRPLSPGPVRGRVNAERRRDHMQQHHGQHLLSRAFVEAAGAATVSFHLGAEATTIDLDRLVTAEQARSAERRANEVVWEARPVRVSTLRPEEARAQGLEPPDGVDAVRVVDAGGYDRQPCSGTHPRTTAGVGVVLLTALERYKGGTRVSFVCGHRALAVAVRHGETLDTLVAALSAPADELPAAALKLKDDAAAAARRASALLERAIDGEARRLIDEARGRNVAPGPAVGAPPLVVTAALDGWPPADLRALATRIVELAPAVAILGSRADKAHLVFAQSDGLPHDVPALLRAAVESLGGRGGGRGNVAQGGGERLDGLEDALASAAAAVRGRG
jgi:alanyl-tRNA synthetase